MADSNIITIPGVMTREMIKTYGTKRVYAPAEELQKATAATNLIPVCMYRDREHGDLDLPDEDIIGWAKLHFQDGKVQSTLFFDPQKMTDEQLIMLSTLEKDNLSPAFRDRRVPEPGVWNYQPYDDIQRDIQWKHIAVVSKGRCSDRHGCGLYKDTFDSLEEPSDKLAQCVAYLISKNHSEDAALAICTRAMSPEGTVGASAFNVANDTLHIWGVPSVPAWQSESDISSSDNTTGIVNVTLEPEATCMTEQLKQKDEEIAKLKAQLDAQATRIEQFEAEKTTRLIEELHVKTGIPKDELAKNERKVLDALLELAPQLPARPGQDVRGSTPSQDAEENDEEDPEYKPRLEMPVGYDHSKGLGRFDALERKEFEV